MAKKQFAGIVFFLAFVTTGWAAPLSPSLIATPPQPQWSELLVQQKIILAPLADGWDSLEYYQQKKWLSIVERFSSMSSLEQRRVQRQMQEWGGLTPEQQDAARKNFKLTSQLPEWERQALKKKWEEYSQLPEDEKEKLKRAPEPLPLRSGGNAPLISRKLTPLSMPQAVAAQTPSLPPEAEATPAHEALPPTNVSDLPVVDEQPAHLEAAPALETSAPEAAQSSMPEAGHRP